MSKKEKDKMDLNNYFKMDTFIYFWYERLSLYHKNIY